MASRMGTRKLLYLTIVLVVASTSRIGRDTAPLVRNSIRPVSSDSQSKALERRFTSVGCTLLGFRGNPLTPKSQSLTTTIRYEFLPVFFPSAAATTIFFRGKSDSLHSFSTVKNCGAGSAFDSSDENASGVKLTDESTVNFISLANSSITASSQVTIG